MATLPPATVSSLLPESEGDRKLLARKLNEVVVPWKRSDTVVHVVREGGKVAPAYYNPKKGDATIDLDEGLPAGTTAATAAGYIGLATRPHTGGRMSSGKLLGGRLCGLLYHETAHSRWSGWMQHMDEAWCGVKVTRQQFAIIELFEEIRIERRAMDHAGGGHPLTRGFLRASFDIILTNLLDSGADFADAYAASTVWLLSAGRVKAKIVEPKEVAAVDAAVRTILDDATVDRLSDILDEAVELDMSKVESSKTAAHFAVQRMVELANEWFEALGIDPTEPTPSYILVVSCSHGAAGEKGEKPEGDDEAPTPGEGEHPKPTEDEGDDEGTAGGDEDGEDADDESEGEGSKAADGGEDESEKVTAWDHSKADSVDPEEARKERAAITDMVKTVTAELMTDVVKSWGDQRPVLADAQEWASKVFRPKRARNTRVWETEKPRPQVMSATMRLARELETLTIPTITTIRKPSALPPGKLRSREAVRASAERSQGLMVDATPWMATRRRHEAVVPMIVGIATDTSGSMGWAEQIVAEAAYMIARAGHRVGARFAAVTFGDKAEMVVRPGEVPTEIHVRSANGATEEFDRAVAALDGVLHLTSGRPGAKVLIIVSDGVLVKHMEPQKAALWVHKMQQAGTIVVQVSGYGTDHHGDRSMAGNRIGKAEVVGVPYYDATPDQLVDAIMRGLRAGVAKIRR